MNNNKTILIKVSFCDMDYSSNAVKFVIGDVKYFAPKSSIINFNKVTKNLQILKWFAKEKGLIN